MKGHYIADVMEGSLAKLYDIKSGDVILTINGMPIEDVLDYRFLIADERVELEIKGKDGLVRNIIIEKDYDQDLGLVFDNPLMDKERVCRNRCIFCFVDQLPKGVRPTLKYKDDDWRLSFLDGNYITLTNLTEHDIDRITKMHISPLYVSIHAVDPKVRSFMLGIPETDNIMNILQRFKEHNIMVHGQMVLCPGINDGDVLDDSIKRLMELWPSLQSLAVVPVGLTEHRQKLYPLRMYEQHTAVSVLDQIEKWQSLCFDRLGTRWVFAADELYLIAQRHWPPYESYEDFPQLENGVGLLAMFEKQFYKGLEKYKIDTHTKVRLSVATGLSAADFMQELSHKLADDYGININVYPIKNNYFGKTVTVAGLVVGGDIIEQLRNVDLGDALLIPKCMLREGETVFLDDMTLDEVRQALNARIRVVDVDGEAFLREVMKYR